MHPFFLNQVYNQQVETLYKIYRLKILKMCKKLRIHAGLHRIFPLGFRVSPVMTASIPLHLESQRPRAKAHPAILSDFPSKVKFSFLAP